MRIQSRADAERNGEHRTRGVADSRAPHDGNLQFAENAASHVTDRRTPSYGRRALRKFSENDATDAAEFPGLTKMRQHAIHLIRFHRAIFEHENRATRVEFPRSAESCFNEGHASAEQNTAGGTFVQR